MKRGKNVDENIQSKLPSMKRGKNVDENIQNRFPSMKTIENVDENCKNHGQEHETEVTRPSYVFECKPPSGRHMVTSATSVAHKTLNIRILSHIHAFLAMHEYPLSTYSPTSYRTRFVPPILKTSSKAQPGCSACRVPQLQSQVRS